MEIKFTNILEVNEDLQKQVRDWRNNLEVRKYMYNEDIISIDTHNKWIHSLRNNDKHMVFVVFKDTIPVGIVSANNINKNHKTCEWAFYLNNVQDRGTGIGALIEYNFLDFLFNKLKIEKVNCEVLEINPKVIKLHKKFGFVEEGIKRSYIIKNDKRLDVYILGITKTEWKEKREKLYPTISRLEDKK